MRHPLVQRGLIALVQVLGVPVVLEKFWSGISLTCGNTSPGISDLR